MNSGAILHSLEQRAAGIRGDVVLEWNHHAYWGGEKRAWARLVDARSGRVLASHNLPRGGANGIAWSQSGRRIAMRSRFGSTQILDEKLQLLHEFKSRIESTSGALAFVNDDQLLEAIPSMGVRALELNSGRPRWTLPTGGRGGRDGRDL